jgi:putative membrane protein
MRAANDCFDVAQREAIRNAVTILESGSACEVVPAVATASGRYDRPEDLIGLWMVVALVLGCWRWLPHPVPGSGDWSLPPLLLGVSMAIAMIAVFITGAWLASRVAWLRRLATPRWQMREEVARRASALFHDARVHQAARGAGILIYVSLFERTAVILAGQPVVAALGQVFIDRLRDRLVTALAAGSPADAILATLAEATAPLAAAMPRQTVAEGRLGNGLVIAD